MVLAAAAILAVAGTGPDVGTVGPAVRAGVVVAEEEEEEDFGAVGDEAHAGARVVDSVLLLVAAGTVKDVSAVGGGAGAGVAIADWVLPPLVPGMGGGLGGARGGRTHGGGLGRRWRRCPRRYAGGARGTVGDGVGDSGGGGEGLERCWPRSPWRWTWSCWWRWRWRCRPQGCRCGCWPWSRRCYAGGLGGTAAAATGLLLLPRGEGWRCWRGSLVLAEVVALEAPRSGKHTGAKEGRERIQSARGWGECVWGEAVGGAP